MNKNLLFILLLFAWMANAQTITIPDGQFKGRLLMADVTLPIAMDASGNNIKVDVNNDGEIQQSEALLVYRLRISTAIIFNLDGINSFTNLTDLDCSSNILMNLDVSALPNLTTLHCEANFIQTLGIGPAMENLYCDTNRITTINGLASANLTQFFCSGNQLVSLDLAHASNLTFLNAFDNELNSLNVTGLTNLQALLCGSNHLTSLNVAGLTNLQMLDCSNNELTALDVSSLSNLKSFSCFYNQLTALDLTPNSLLETVNCGENNIATVNLSGLQHLSNLQASYLPNNATINAAGTVALHNFLYTGSNTTLNLNGFPGANSINLVLPQPAVTLNVAGLNNNVNLFFSGSAITNLTVNGTGPTQLKTFNCSHSALTNLTLTGLDNLQELILGNNQLTSLNLTGLTGLTKLEIPQNKITTLNLSALPNLKHLDANNNKLTALNLTAVPNLEYLDISNSALIDIVGNQVTSLNLSGLSQLKFLDCSNYLFAGALGAAGNLITTLDINSLSQLETVRCVKNNVATLQVNGLTQLKHLNVSQNLLTSLDLIGLTNLTELFYAQNQLSNLNMTGLVNITNLDCSGNNINTLTVVNMPNLKQLNCSSNELNTLNLSGLNQITWLDCSGNNITALDLSDMPGLGMLNCGNNPLGNLSVNHLTNLEYLQCDNNMLTSLTVDALVNLRQLNCISNQLTNLEVGTLVNLLDLNCDYNQLAVLHVNMLPELRSLSCSNNQLTALEVNNLPTLQTLECNHNMITSLIPATGAITTVVACASNQLTTLDLSALPNLQYVYCQNNQLSTLFVKNGSYEYAIDFTGNTGLTYICADNTELASVQSQLNAAGMTGTVCNSYCSDTPGGPYNTLIGTTIFDGNNNGCNANDPLHPNIRIDINDGTTTGSAFTNLEGNATFYTEAGSYTMSPNIENASAFNISPASASVSFSNNNYNISNQSFCLSANGVHPDVEVVVMPVGPARPGFDAEYKIVFKNKGNQTLSGNVVLNYEEPKIDFLSAAPLTALESPGSLTWFYDNLLPFESRAIQVIFNVNSPVETPPVNNDDMLSFSTSVTPVAADETPADNAFTLNQIVVGPFDPNDKTCLEGETISTAMIGQYLHYAINFENLGTAEAVNVIVRDVIDTNKFDLSTLQVLHTSHEMQSVIRGNVVEFVFRNINLAPVAGDPPVGGHGTILFKIKTRNSLSEGDTVENTANIYFDYNAPIDTNTARTTFATLAVSDFEADASITVHPNPARDFVNIQCDSSIQNIELFDIQGRLIQSVIEHKKQVKLDISAQANGIYFARISSEKGKTVAKIIKE